MYEFLNALVIYWPWSVKGVPKRLTKSRKPIGDKLTARTFTVLAFGMSLYLVTAADCCYNGDSIMLWLIHGAVCLIKMTAILHITDDSEDMSHCTLYIISLRL